jgi:hypothetical protein
MSGWRQQNAVGGYRRGVPWCEQKQPFSVSVPSTVSFRLFVAGVACDVVLREPVRGANLP